MVKGPPYQSGLPYFKRSFERWCAANRPGWTTDDRRLTAMTLWYGDLAIQNFYIKKIGKKHEYPMQREHLVPATPWNQGDVDTARTTRTLPIVAAPAMPPAIPSAPALTIHLAAPLDTLPVIPSLQGPPVPPPPPQAPTTVYPFNFWPDISLLLDPTNDDSIGPGITIEAIKGNKDGAKGQWLATKPFMWPPKNEDDWEGKRFLAAGAYGCAGLWCKRDDNNNVIEHLVVKESRPKRQQWRDPCFWRDQIPREIRMHQLVDGNRGIPGHDHDTLVKHRGHRLMMTQQRYRIFLDYYQGGDLWGGFHDHFRRMKEVYTEDSKLKNVGLDWDAENYCYRTSLTPGEAGLYGKIPEGLIWNIASSLVQACQILHFGQVGQGGVQNTKPGWEPIKHCDIRLANIFMQPAARKDEYPTFVLADFGLSFTDLGATDNPHEYVWERIDERFAPELHHVMKNVPAGAGVRPIDEKTDVWQIGAIMYSLLSNGIYPDADRGPCRGAPGYDMLAPAVAGPFGDLGSMINPAQHPWEDMNYFPTFKRYSEELQRLTMECLTWKPNERPALIDVRDSIDNVLMTHPNIANDRNMETLVVGREREFGIGNPFDGGKSRG